MRYQETLFKNADPFRLSTRQSRSSTAPRMSIAIRTTLRCRSRLKIGFLDTRTAFDWANDSSSTHWSFAQVVSTCHFGFAACPDSPSDTDTEKSNGLRLRSSISVPKLYTKGPRDDTNSLKGDDSARSVQCGSSYKSKPVSLLTWQKMLDYVS